MIFCVKPVQMRMMTNQINHVHSKLKSQDITMGLRRYLLSMGDSRKLLQPSSQNY